MFSKKYIHSTLVWLLFLNSLIISAQNSNDKLTYCNPVNLNYRFCLDEPSRREAADPVIVNFKGEYFLFASKSGGYWYSSNLVDWNFVTTPDLPIEDYAPAAVVINDEIYFTASTNGDKVPVIYKSAKPKTGRWEVVNSNFPIQNVDPDLFLDDDGRLYLYYGCSNIEPLYAVELDRTTFMPIGEPVACMNADIENNGWERPGDYNERSERPWTEGAWMTKFNGKYYLQYSTPGTEFRSYADGMYVADNPLGPFKLSEYNPFSYRPSGFATGAGHSATFQDNYGNYWHISSTTISVKHKFERRLSLFPVFFNEDGYAYTYTGFGDYPISIPQRKIENEEDYLSGWMLLSYNKKVTASSSLPEYGVEKSVDENIRTYWSAKDGKKGQWLQVDLEDVYTVNAVQLNFAEHTTTILGRDPGIYYQYMLEYSTDGKTWQVLADKTKNKEDAPHDYIVVQNPVKARYVRVKNYHTPSGTFAMSGFRVFGNGSGAKPAAVTTITAERQTDNNCSVKLNWEKIENTTGYNIRYGTAPDKLFLNYQVYGDNHIQINSLSKKQNYYFVVDSFNENGITKGSTISEIK
ncbi:endo-1,4-beta-xylanase [Flavobacterium suaedae]|uniref:Endo-1,4-beta-xylanase n=1 Tax=Flavobacterium suaedae TaxID=1767027 RepID=A0ABQ1JM49_9FLAO|nr:family 43 glycosylhydrolase [Flavobacterium suaedae]GGB72547.1 endo-1,4-beta-xylanase [Flavobacterium suaedae]